MVYNTVMWFPYYEIQQQYIVSLPAIIVDNVDNVPVFKAASTQIRLLSLCHVLCVVFSQREYSLLLPEGK